MTPIAFAATLAFASGSNPSACTAATATATTIERIASRPWRWLGRCVKLSGAMQYSSLFSGVEGFYLSARRDPGARSLETPLRHRIGLYGDLPWAEELARWSVVGRVDSCERIGREARRETDRINRQLRSSGSDEFYIPFLSGYCHYFSGAVVDAVEFSPTPGQPYYRVVGSASRRRYGNLVPARPDWRGFRQLQQRAEAFLHALREGDEHRLSSLHGQRRASRTELNYLLRDPGSPFRELREMGPRPFVLLYETFDRRGRTPEQQRSLDAFVCYCRDSSCEERWPISSVDVADTPGRPYACVSVVEDTSGTKSMRAVQRAAPLRESPKQHCAAHVDAFLWVSAQKA